VNELNQLPSVYIQVDKYVLDLLDSFLERPGALKAQRLGCPVAFIAQVFNHGAILSIQKTNNVINQLSIICSMNSRRARRVTTAQVKTEAGTEIRIRVDCPFTRPEWKYPVQRFDDFPRPPDAEKGADIHCSIAFFLKRNLDSRKIVIYGNFDIRRAVDGLETRVISGLVFFYQARFQQ
jgi:hypothetical protein